MKGRIPIKRWIDEDKPREKLLDKGARALTNAELIAILLGSGSTEKSAVGLAREILAVFENDLERLGNSRFAELKRFHGVGPAKAIAILAALELGRRRTSGALTAKPKMTTSSDIYEYMLPYLEDLSHEEFWVILLSRSNQVLSRESISKGGVSGTFVDAKIIFQKALDNLASSLVLIHNHPSGQLKPSDQDIALTRKLRDAGNLLDIKVLDHLIIGKRSYFSFADEGLL